MIEWALIALTKDGLQYCQILQEQLAVPCDILTIEKRETEFTDHSFKRFADMMKSAFGNYRVLVCVMATGIVVRSIASLLTSKQTDPAVLVMDQNGRFCISLLSGHIGQANQYAQYVAKKTGALAVITTASDNLGKIAVDTLAQQLKCLIVNFEDAKEITAMIINNEPVMINIHQPNLPENMNVDTVEHQHDYHGAVLVSNRTEISIQIPFVQLIPKNIIIGIGCRRGMDYQSILTAIRTTLKRHKISEEAIQKLSTIDLKHDEQGILEASSFLQVPLQVVDREEIKPIEKQFECSEFVQKTIGVGCVAEPCGFLASNKGAKICGKTKLNGITISIWEENRE